MLKHCFYDRIFPDFNYWMIGSDYTVNVGGVSSVKSGQPLLGIKWEYTAAVGEPWIEDDDTLSVIGKSKEDLSSVYMYNITKCL